MTLKTIGDGQFPRAGHPTLSIYLSFVGFAFLIKKKKAKHSEIGGRQSLKLLHLFSKCSAKA